MRISSQTVIIIVENRYSMATRLPELLTQKGYQVKKVSNNKTILEHLSNPERRPDLIIADAHGNELSGPEFCLRVRQNPLLVLIPVLMIGQELSLDERAQILLKGADMVVDSSVTVDFLMNVVDGALTKHKLVMESLELRKRAKESERELEISPKAFFIIQWDEVKGPILKDCVPKETCAQGDIDLLGIGVQIFNAMVSMYGQVDFGEADGLFLPIKNCSLESYVFFDSQDDLSVRGGDRIFMIAVVSEKIPYHTTIALKRLFSQVSSMIKNEDEFDVESIWLKVRAILS